MLGAIENGAWSPSLQARLDELERSKLDLTAQLEATPAPSKVVRLHLDMAELYRERVAALERALCDPEVRQEASEALQALIERVVLTPDAGAPDRLRIELAGDLATILTLAAGDESKRLLRRGCTHTDGRASAPSRLAGAAYLLWGLRGPATSLICY